MTKAIYPYAIEQVTQGAKFFVDFENKSLSVGRHKIIVDGQVEKPLGINVMAQDDAIEEIENLYQDYKHSIPSERSERKKTEIFQSFKRGRFNRRRYAAWRTAGCGSGAFGTICSVLHTQWFVAMARQRVVLAVAERHRLNNFKEMDTRITT